MIYIILDTELTGEERQTIVRAAKEAQPMFPGCRLEVVAPGNSPNDDAIRRVIDKYIEKTLKENGKYDASAVLDNMKYLVKRKKEARAILMFTGRDLCMSSHKLPWCFGASRIKGGSAVCSVYRYRPLTAPERLRCIRRTMMHEIGHVFGLASDLKRKNTAEHAGPHCTAPGCCMRQTADLPKLLACSLEEEQRGRWFCPDCQAELDKALSDEADGEKK